MDRFLGLDLVRETRAEVVWRAQRDRASVRSIKPWTGREPGDLVSAVFSIFQGRLGARMSQATGWRKRSSRLGNRLLFGCWCLLGRRRGMSSVEYALLLALIVVMGIGAWSSLAGKLTNVLNTITNSFAASH